MSEVDDHQKFAAPQASEELHQGIPAPVTFGTSPIDGMPMQVATQNHDIPPPLSEDSLVCMEDKRSFVIRNSDGSVWVSFAPTEVSRLPNGEHYVEVAVLMARVNAVYPDREIDYRDNRDNFSSLGSISNDLSITIRRSGSLTNVVRVEPARPACAHYLRMQTDISADRDRRYMQRSCMAQKTEEGEFYSLRDTRIVACNIRSPRHFESEAAMDEFDDEKLRIARERQEMGEFDVDAELAAEKGLGGLGVLGG